MIDSIRLDERILEDIGWSVHATYSGPVDDDDLAALCVLGHGIANDKDHALLRDLSMILARRGVGTLRFNYPYKERGAAELDSPEVRFSVFEAAIQAARSVTSIRVPLVIGGKSLSARMAAALQVTNPVCDGLLYLGYPLHKAGDVSRLRDRDLYEIRVPQLFVEGSADPLCRLDMISSVVERIQGDVTLRVVEGADHSVGVTADGSDEDSRMIIGLIADWVVEFLADHLGVTIAGAPGALSGQGGRMARFHSASGRENGSDRAITGDDLDGDGGGRRMV